MNEEQNSYRYLEWRPHRWRKTPYIKDDESGSGM